MKLVSQSVGLFCFGPQRVARDVNLSRTRSQHQQCLGRRENKLKLCNHYINPAVFFNAIFAQVASAQHWQDIDIHTWTLRARVGRQLGFGCPHNPKSFWRICRFPWGLSPATLTANGNDRRPSPGTVPAAAAMPFEGSIADRLGFGRMASKATRADAARD